MSDTLTQMENMAQTDAAKTAKKGVTFPQAQTRNNSQSGFELPAVETGKVRLAYTGYRGAPKIPNLSANRDDIKYFYPIEAYDENGNALSYYDVNKDTAVPNLARGGHFALLFPTSLVCNFRDVNGYYSAKKVEAVSSEKAFEISKEKEARALDAMTTAKEKGKKLDEAQETLRNSKAGKK